MISWFRFALPVMLIAATLLTGCVPAAEPTQPAQQPTDVPTAASTAIPATVVPTAPPPTAEPTEVVEASATAEEASDEPVTYVMPGDDWGFPSPFNFYQRGPGYVRMAYLFDSLIWKDSEGYVPWLAEDWSVAEDDRTWTFTMREGVTWHDGQPLTAHDAAFSFTYLKWAFEQGMVSWTWPLSKVESARASADGRTLTVVMTEPTAGLLTDLFGSLPMIPQHIWDGVEDPVQKLDEESTIGTGMFTLTEYSKEEGRYVYDANPDFFRGKPTVDRLVFIKVKDQSLALLSHEIDEASFSGKAIVSVQELKGAEGLEIVQGPSDWVLKLYMNTTRAPLDQRAVRQAIAYAVDRQEIVDKAQLGGAVVASTGIMSPGSYWHKPDLPAYALDRARSAEMLAEAGVGDLALEVLTTESYVREAEIIQANLAEVGIEVTVKTGDRATVDSIYKEGSFDLLITGHGGTANPDMDSPSPAWENARYQAVYEQSARAVVDEDRRELAWQMQDILAEELPVLTLWHPMMWEVYWPGHATPFYTPEGIDGGIPMAVNKMMFLD